MIRASFMKHPLIVLGIVFLFLSILSLACEKIKYPNQEPFSFAESPDSVFIKDSRIYTCQIYDSDSVITYLQKYDNPVSEENIADPSLIRGENGIFYLFSTESGKYPNVPIFKSKDLINWYFVHSAFTFETRPSSLNGNIWAPDINYIDGRYVMYYSMSVWGGEMDCGIGVAVSDYPYGPFSDYAKLFDSREIGVQNSIDPFYFEDNGKKYLFWGSFRGIFGILLSDDGLSIAKGSSKFQIAGQGTEGTYIHKRDGYFYLFVSTGTCCEGISSTYKVMVGRSENLMGPYYDQQGRSLFESIGTVFLQGNAFVAGPGHNSEFITDDNGDDWVLYHGYLKENPELSRILFIDKVYWENGWPHILDQSPSVSSEIPFFKSGTKKESLLKRLSKRFSVFGANRSL